MDRCGWQHIGCAVILTCSASLSRAAENFFDLDLKALGNIKVTSASRVEQTIQKAPSVISVITRQDIERYGANNLYDVMQYFPGFLSLSSGAIGRSGMALRGDSSFSSERFLTLIDGKPYRSMNSAGYVTNTLYQNFPLSGVDRIELIRGPGSAMYGTGAVSGVINIITRKAISKSSGEVSAQSGTYDSNQESFFWGSPDEGNNNWRVNTAANVSKSDGWVVHDGAGTELNNYNKGQSLLVDVSNDHFYVKSLLMNMDANYPSLALADPNNIQDITQQYIDTGYNTQINQQSSFDVHYSHLSIDNGLLNIQNTEDLVEANVFSNLSESTLFQAGLSLNKSQSDTTNNNITGLENYPEFRGGLYAQINNQFDKQWSTYVGGQWNKTEGSDGSFSPRLGLIYAHDEVSGAKLLYSEAFRLPDAAESNETFMVAGITDPVFVGNSNLSSETVKTTDLQWYHYATTVNYTVTLFKSDYQNRLRPQPLEIAFTPFPVVITPGKWVQDSDLHVYGVEWEGKFNFTPQDNMMSSFVWQRNYDSNDMSDTTLVPRWIASLGYAHTFNNKVVWSIYNQHVSEFSKSTIVATTPNPDPESYDLLSSKISAPLSIMSTSNQSVELFARAVNLLDEKVWQPEFVVGGNSIPQAEAGGRAMYVGVKVNW